jgi:hypothetical protein
MKVKSGALAIAASLAAIVLVATPAAAAPPESLTGDGVIAMVGFSTSETIQCADGSTAERILKPYVQAERILFNPSGTPVTVEFESLYVEISDFNGCDQTSTLASGELLFGRGDFDVSQKAKTATVGARMTLVDETGADYGVVVFDLAFVATSHPDVIKNQQRYKGRYEKTFVRTSEKLRVALVTGVFALDGQDLLAGAGDIQGALGTETFRSMTVVPG